MLQNRVDPFGKLIKINARGSWMGNRGVLHDEQQNIVLSFKCNAWITCVLDFRERKRQVMAPHRYTELFFLDEATAFAAGHRPCFECRRNDFNRFKFFWLKGNPEYGFNDKTPIQNIDEILHAERLDKNGQKVCFVQRLNNISHGTFVLYREQPFLFADNKLFSWSAFGYDGKSLQPDVKQLTVFTPRSVTKAFQAGYVPQIKIP